MKRLALLLVLVLALSTGNARAQSACGPLPFTFVNGTVADATQVNTNFSTLLTCINAISTSAHTATNATLKALATASLTTNSRVTRDGFYAAGDGGMAFYTFSASPCTIGSGAGDNGSQVQPNSGTGCWIADFSVSMPTPKVWGAIGNGTTDDSAPVQAAVTALANETLYIDKATYKIVTGVTSSSPIAIKGMNGRSPVYATSCVSGFVVRSDITPISLRGSTGLVDNTCFDMGSAGARGAGAVVAFGNAAIQTGGWLFTNNTIISPYRGFDADAATTGATQTNGATFRNNVIINPVISAIAQGRNSSGQSQPGFLYDNNQIACFVTGAGTGNANAVGIEVHDGAFEYRGGDVGPYNCKYGSYVVPGTAGGAAQAVGGFLSGVLGDSSVAGDAYFDTASALGTLFYIRMENCWNGAVSAGDTPLTIKNSGGGATKTRVISVVGCTLHGALANTHPLIDLQNDVDSLIITNNQLCADGGGTQNVGTKVAATVTNLIYTNNNMNCFDGTLAKGLQLAAAGVGGGIWVVADNILTGTTPLDWAPNRETAVVHDNLGVDNVTPTVASGASITLPVNRMVNISGVAAIADMAGAWGGRRVTIIPSGAFTLVTGGAAGTAICSAYGPATPALSFDLIWSEGDGCWVRVGG